MLGRCENGVGAGPLGMTFEHLRDAAITNALVSTHLHALVNTILGGNLPASVANLLTTSRLIALAKSGGGARPITIGECLTRLAAKAALSAMGEAAHDFFLPLHVQLLGSFVGPDRGAAQLLSGQLREMAKPLPLLEKADPQVASLLLTRCISRRVAYLTRTTLLRLLPRDTWSQWGMDLLTTLLNACGIRIPTHRAEQSRVWAQASLPPSLGGIGITDPLIEGVYGYTASFTQAALFLASLECAPRGTLTQAQDHMLLPADITTPLHEWLTECEAALPLDAREILEKERLKRSDMRLQHALALQVHGSRYAVQVQETRHMELNPLSGHMQRMISLTGYGTGDWLTAIPIAANRRIGPVHFSNAVRFRLALPFSTPKTATALTIPLSLTPASLTTFSVAARASTVSTPTTSCKMLALAWPKTQGSSSIARPRHTAPLRNRLRTLR
ncbi:unnamed protein product [Closterium sp. NIES-54]